MRLLDLALPTAAENLALDEALLEEAELGGRPAETLRLWEPAGLMVVVGRSSRAADEVRLDVCRELGIPVLRRPSGGAAVVAGPGCLMYALVLSLERRPELRAVERAHRFVLNTLAAALRPLVPGIACDGTSDLVLTAGAPLRYAPATPGCAPGRRVGIAHQVVANQRCSPVGGQCPPYESAAAIAAGEPPRKVSGNSVRTKRGHLLYHGTLLYDFSLASVGRLLAMPPRQPGYRGGRRHEDFLANLPAPAAALRQALISAWAADKPLPDWPRSLTARLAAEKYGRPEWNGQL